MGEESSGIIPARFLGSRRFLLTSMWHRPTDDVETFERGQLLADEGAGPSRAR